MGDASEDPGVEIVGPFNEYRLVVDGWQVPFVQACEVDGGMVDFTIDNRFAYLLPASVFPRVAQMLAQSIAIAVGYPSKPEGDMDDERRARWSAHVHPAHRFHRMVGISGVDTEHVHEIPDDPRYDEEGDPS